MEFLSHIEIENKEITYKKLLKDHLSDVAKNIKAKVKEVYKDDVLAEAGYIVGISHDFGKYTTFFRNISEQANQSPILSGIVLYRQFLLHILWRTLKIMRAS